MHARYARLLVVLGGIVLGFAAYDVQIDNLGPATTSLKAAAGVVAAWSFLAAGVAVWSRRPGNLLGPIMVATCFALLARQLRYSHDPLVFTMFFALGELGFALVAHSALAYPWGHVRDGTERLFLKITYVTVLAFPIAILLFHDGQTRLRYFDPYPRESLISLTGDPGVTSFLEDAYAVIAYGLLSVVAFVSPVPEFVSENVLWWQVTSLIALPLALFVGLIRSRLAHANIGDLVLRLENVTPAGIRDELATALRDPTLEVYFWLPEQNAFVDVHGLPVELPEDGPTRAVTLLEHDAEPLAAVVHDPILRDEPDLIEVAAAAARLALENARLQAEVQAQLAKVKESRARIVAAGDEQRRRIERDLHDGAQQRLVALALELKSEQRRLDGKGDPVVDRLLSDAAEEVQVAVEELRALAGGIHPGILTQGGLAVALGALAGKAPVPVTVDAPIDRLQPEIEATAYFVASEALTNVAKHARASSATITAF